MALLLGASSSKRRQVGAEAGEDETAATEEDRISALPEELRLRILGLLSLKSAIRTGTLSSRWRDLWASRWPAPSSLDLHLLPDGTPEQILESLEHRGRRRLDRFSLTIHPRRTFAYRPRYHHNMVDLSCYLDYATACDVEDLHIDMEDYFMRSGCNLYFPPGSYRLARLSLRGIGRLFFGFSWSCDAFSALEVLQLCSVRSVQLNKLLSACPRLRTLDLRYCKFLDSTIHVMSRGAAHLRSLTVEWCDVNEIDAGSASGLRSFRLSTASLPTYSIPATAPLDDLCICFGEEKSRNPISYWIRVLPDLASLTALTICSTALRRVYALARFGSAACLTKFRSLPGLRELQLHMFNMDSANLAYIYTFFRTCRCPQLERLFVQLPTNEANEELSEEKEPHEEQFVEDDIGGELSKGYETGKIIRRRNSGRIYAEGKAIQRGCV